MKNNTPWNNDKELFELVRRELFTGVVGDVMDSLGYQHQFLPPQVRALQPEKLLIGRAMTVLEADVFHHTNGKSDQPVMDRAFGVMFDALDDLKEDEIYICSGSSPRYALWGELMSTKAKQLGAVGAIVNGYHRDTKGILALNFPTFSFGAYAQDQGPRGKVIAWRVPIEIEGVRINDGDILIGDIDGVCVIPKQIEQEVFIKSLEKASTEKLVQKSLQEGMSTVDAWDQFGVM
ncbi:MAG: RraA family protein [Thalassotalea sp.]|nr:RraA family protein [Thalassotalea sp.]